MAKAVYARGILLDMDGTLVQSTDVVETVWEEWCRIHSVPVEDVLRICHGVRSRDVISQVAPRLDVEKEAERLEALEIKYSSNGACIPGADKFLKKLAKAPWQSWAIVTSAGRKVALHRLNLCHLPLPEQLISAEDVVKGKPDAEPYRTGAQRLNVATADCLVFEDALAGIRSGLAAGCRVVQIGEKEALHKGVWAVIQDWQQIKVAIVDKQYKLTISE
ncbi:MAG: Putative phosphatase [Candidatus Tokpelaia hoelldobleri]|uniref:Phosphatase n=1 Tax=Candidatus Tokpelaia hoelldobleri TaxID=1902579 RepID=A0A1U9JTU1_9HYPH|nr:MAG: Putative phosphatase [Candidatus Tokpelaia hoelldoblerii]